MNYKKNIQSILLTLTFSVVLISGAISQTYTSTGNGDHEFLSLQPAENLSFYLFGDGYHSFEQNPVHNYTIESVIDPTHFRTDPYEDDDVEESPMDPTTDTGSTGAADINMVNRVQIKRSWNLVQGKQNYLILSFENQESTPISGCLEFYYNDADLGIDPTEILDDEYVADWVYNFDVAPSTDPLYSHKLVWDYDDLGGVDGEQRHIYIKALCAASPFSRIKTKAVMNVEVAGNCSFNDHTGSALTNSSTYTLNSVVKNNPHDPNCIVALPHALYECDTEQKVTYKVYFHNEGDDPAQNVLVDLFNKAPMSNVKLISASDPVDMEWNPSGEIDFGFKNIYLRGLGETNPEAPSLESTYGYVEFEVCYNLADFTALDLECANISGGIIFDDEAPIEVENEICRVIDCTTGWIRTPGYAVENIGFDYLARCEFFDSFVQSNFGPRLDPRKNQGIIVYPTLTQDLLTIDNLYDLNVNTDISITNLNGQMIYNTTIEKLNGRNEISVSDLTNGIYFLTISNESIKETHRFVKF